MKKILTLVMGILMGCCAFCSGCDFLDDFLGGGEKNDSKEIATDEVAEEDWLEIFENTIEYLYGSLENLGPLVLPKNSNYKLEYKCNGLTSSCDFKTFISTWIVADGQMHCIYDRIKGTDNAMSETEEMYVRRNERDAQEKDCCDIFRRTDNGEWRFSQGSDVMPIDYRFVAELFNGMSYAYYRKEFPEEFEESMKEIEEMGKDWVYSYQKVGDYYEGPSLDVEHAPEEKMYDIKIRYKIQNGKIVSIENDECYMNSPQDRYSYSVKITYGGQNVKIPLEALSAKS